MTEMTKQESVNESISYAIDNLRETNNFDYSYNEYGNKHVLSTPEKTVTIEGNYDDDFDEWSLLVTVRDKKSDDMVARMFDNGKDSDDDLFHATVDKFMMFCSVNHLPLKSYVS